MVLKSAEADVTAPPVAPPPVSLTATDPETAPTPALVTAPVSVALPESRVQLVQAATPLPVPEIHTAIVSDSVVETISAAAMATPPHVLSVGSVWHAAACFIQGVVQRLARFLQHIRSLNRGLSWWWAPLVWLPMIGLVLAVLRGLLRWLWRVYCAMWRK